MEVEISGLLRLVMGVYIGIRLLQEVNCRLFHNFFIAQGKEGIGLLFLTHNTRPQLSDGCQRVY